MRRPLAQRTPFYYGWVIVAFGFVFGAFNVGMTSWGLGVFVTPMQEDLEWDRSLVFLPLLVGAIVTTPLGIIVGPWADTKNGPRILALAGILLFGASLLYMKVAGSELGYIFIFGIVGGLGRFSVAMALVVVPKWFVRRRGLAQATVSAGFSVGPLIFPLILQALVESVGWRDAWFIMGIALIVLAGPGAFFIIRSPEDVGLRPDGDRDDTLPTGARRARRTPRPRRARHRWLGGQPDPPRGPAHLAVLDARGGHRLGDAGHPRHDPQLPALLHLPRLRRHHRRRLDQRLRRAQPSSWASSSAPSPTATARSGPSSPCAASWPAASSLSH